MNHTEKNDITARIVYIVLTVMAAVILCVTLYTYFGGAARRGKETEAADTSKEPGIVTKSPYVTNKPDVMTTLPPDTDKMGVIDSTPDTDKPKDTEDVALTPPDTDDTPVVAPIEAMEFTNPVDGRVTKKHDLLTPVFSLTMSDYRVHRGIDVEATLGSAVKACAAGVVKAVGNDAFMGLTVVIDHGDGILSTYSNLDPTVAEGIYPGAKVELGQTVGCIGESAAIEIADEPHLHFEITVDSKMIDPLEVLDYSDSDQPVFEDEGGELIESA